MASSPELIGPSSHFYVSQRLRLHYVDWGNSQKPLLLLVHGGRDHARSGLLGIAHGFLRISDSSITATSTSVGSISA